jgi:hypothetical protein
MPPHNKNAGNTNNAFIICDANVILQMTIFNAKKMFDCAQYSFGELQVHQATQNELKRWLRPGSLKLKKFGKDIIELAIIKSETAGFRLSSLTTEEKLKKFKTYQLLEDKLASDKRSADTSDEDKLILALAEKNKCFLATQESTLRNLATSVIADGLLSFEDLIADLYIQTQLSKEDLINGLHSLDYMKEKLRHDQKQKILSLLK